MHIMHTYGIRMNKNHKQLLGESWWILALPPWTTGFSLRPSVGLHHTELQVPRYLVCICMNMDPEVLHRSASKPCWSDDLPWFTILPWALSLVGCILLETHQVFTRCNWNMSCFEWLMQLAIPTSAYISSWTRLFHALRNSSCDPGRVFRRLHWSAGQIGKGYDLWSWVTWRSRTDDLGYKTS